MEGRASELIGATIQRTQPIQPSARSQNCVACPADGWSIFAETVTAAREKSAIDRLPKEISGPGRNGRVWLSGFTPADWLGRCIPGHAESCYCCSRSFLEGARPGETENIGTTVSDDKARCELRIRLRECGCDSTLWLRKLYRKGGQN